MNKKDFSKTCLSQSLIELLRDKEYDEISIQDIVDKAGFSRNTYYRNFNNIDEILDYYLDSYVDKFIADSKIHSLPVDSNEYFNVVTNHFTDSQTIKLYSLLIKRGLIDHIVKQFYNRFNKRLFPNQDSFFRLFTIGGFFSIYVEYLLNRLPMSKEEAYQKAIEFNNILKKATLENN